MSESYASNPALAMAQRRGESYASNSALAMALRRGRLSDQLLADSLKPRNVGGHAGGLAQMGTALIGGVMAGLEDRRIDQLLKRQEDARRQSMAQMLAGPSAPAETLAAPAAPVEMPAQSEGAMVTPAAAPSRVSAAPMPPPDLMQHFEAASAETGIPVPVLVAQARQESNFNPQARGRAGEIGVMQIMPSTARQPGFGMAGVDPATLDDPGENIRFGARYLRARGGANADFNDPQALATALRNYNGGGDPRYVENVMRFMPQDVATPAALNPAQMPQAPAAQAPAVTPPSRRGASDTVTIGGQNFSMRGIMAAMSDPDPQVSQYARTLFTAAQSQERESFGQPTEMTDANGQRVMVQVGNRGTIRPVQGYSAPPAEPRQSDIERRIDLMVQNGVPREMAVGLSTNQFETRQDPQDGTITIIDRSNGRVLFGPNAGGIIGQPAAPAAPAAPGAPGAPAVPGAPGNVDFRGATGAPGLVAETANFVADLFGGRNLPAPQVAAGAQALRNLDTRTRMFLQSAIPGRPSNYLMEMIGGLTVSPAEIRLGPERATERVQQTTRFLEQTVRELEEIAGGQGTGRFTRQDIGEANRVLVSLRPLLNDYRTLEGALTSRPERAPPPPRRGTLGNRSAPAPAGVDPQLWNVMTPEERALWQN